MDKTNFIEGIFSELQKKFLIVHIITEILAFSQPIFCFEKKSV